MIPFRDCEYGALILRKVRWTSSNEGQQACMLRPGGHQHQHPQSHSSPPRTHSRCRRHGFTYERQQQGRASSASLHCRCCRSTSWTLLAKGPENCDYLRIWDNFTSLSDLRSAAKHDIDRAAELNTMEKASRLYPNDKTIVPPGKQEDE